MTVGFILFWAPVILAYVVTDSICEDMPKRNTISVSVTVAVFLMVAL